MKIQNNEATLNDVLSVTHNAIRRVMDDGEISVIEFE